MLFYRIVTEAKNHGDLISSPEFDKSWVSFGVWLGAHEFENDYDGLGPLLRGRQYDIWIPEAVGATSQHEELFRNIAAGDRRAYQQALRMEWKTAAFLPLIKSLYGAHIKVFFADYSNDQAEADEVFHRLHGEDNGGDRVSSLDEAIAYHFDLAHQASGYYARREVNIVENIETKLPEFIEQHKKLRDSDNIRILISMGLAHINLPLRLAEAGYEVATTMPDIPPSPVVELGHKIQKGEDIDRKLLVMAGFQIFLSPVMSHRDQLKLGSYFRQIAESLSEEETSRLAATACYHGPKFMADFANEAVLRLGIIDPDLKVDAQLATD